MLPPFLAKGNAASVADYIEAIEYVINIAGEDSVGIGTDFTQDLERACSDPCWVDCSTKQSG
jgi:microsomal dipeptidase-like Zn-dependent dipeptidase